MKFFLAIIDALVNFVQRRPLTVLFIVILAVGAPSLLKGIALFFLYFMLGILILVVASLFALRWRVNKMRKQMEEQFGQQGGFSSPFTQPQEPREPQAEGEVRVHTTSDTPTKKVSSQVGDYVEFEEEKSQE